MRSKTSPFRGGRRWWVLALAVILAGAAGPSAVAQDPLHARVAFDSGGSMVKGAADEDWSYATVNTLVMPGDTLWVDEKGTLEVEMSGGTFLRMADGSKADIVSLPPSGVIKGWTGAFYVQRISRSSGSVIFQSPVADMHVQNDTQVRVDILTNGATTVSVHWGAVTIRAPGGEDTILQTGQRSYIDPGYLPSLPEPFDRGEEDSFDAWNRERAQLLAVGLEAVPTTVIKDTPVGVEDLGTYGDWVTIDNDPYWRPTVVTDYVPYRYGHWSYVPTIGYSWVGDYPFAYVTSHYGRWRYHPSYGWCWRYRDVWGPAWVATYRVGPNFVWCPLDPWDRPVVYGNDFYYMGGLQFSVFASSYCPADYLFYGGHYINPFHSSLIHGIPATEINIWNINFGTRRPHFPYPDSHMAVRDYAPRRAIRGPMALDHEGTLARGRVERLESSVGRRRFETAGADVRRSVRTPEQPTSREARARSVRLAPEAASVTPEARGRRLATTDIGGIRDRGRGADRSPSAPGARVEPGESQSRGGIDRGRGGEPSVRDRSVREAPESGVGGVPPGRSRGGRERGIRRVEETPGAPSSEPRSIAPDETPSFRGRGEGGGVRERTTREPVDAGGAETRTPSRGRGEAEGRSIRRDEPSGPTAEPSPRSTESPRRTESPSIRRNEPSGPTAEPSPRSIESPRRTEAPSPRSIEAPQRPEAPSVRTPSHGRSSMRVEPQVPSRPDVISRGGPSPRSIEPPRAQAPQVMPRSMRSEPSVPQYSRPSMPAPQVSRPSMPSPRSMEMPSPSPRMSSPDRGGRGPSMGEAPSIRGGSSHSGGRSMDGGGRSMGGGRSSRGR
ncbi:MAG: hypothetical protein NTZ09_10005 [Candidatus Hydrogenedentes bacterium]|nr:hypothetical protein [Candidatus Hydrogenedentota bacterium]